MFVMRDDPSLRQDLQGPNGEIQRNVRKDTRDQAVGNGVGERHDSERDKGGHRISHVRPVDILCDLAHHRPDKNERAARRPRWDGGKNRREEHRDEEADGRHDGCQAGCSTFRDTGTGFHKRRDGRQSEKRTDRDAHRVDNIRNRRAFKILRLLVDGAAESRHGVERTGRVKDVDVQEGDQGETELARAVGQIPLQHIKRLLDGMKRDNLPEKVKRVLPLGGVREVCDIRGARPGDDGDKKNPGDDGAFDTVHHQEASHDTTHDADPEGRAPHLGRPGTDAVGQILCWTSGESHGGISAARDGTNTGTVGEANKG